MVSPESGVSEMRALSALDVERLRVQLLKIAWALTGDANAEDLVHETLAALMKSTTAVDHPSAYARVALINRIRSHWRRLERERSATRRARQRATPEIALPEPSGEVWAAVQELPFRQRVAVVLVVVDDLPLRAVADHLGCSTETARTHLRRGKTRLASTLRHLEQEQS